MTGRWRLVAAAGFVVVCIAGAIATVLGTPADGRIGVAVMTPAFVVPPLVGGLILVRRPENRIGWLFCLLGFGLVATMASAAVVDQAIASGPVPSWVVPLMWVGQWLYLVFFVPAALVIMTFPSGHLPSRRWRPVALAVIASAIASGLGAAFGRTTLVGSEVLRPPNPFVAAEPLRSMLAAAGDVGDLASVLMLVPAAAAVVTRMRRAKGVERLQLKWFAYAVAMLGLALPASTLLQSAEAVGLQWGLAVLGLGAALPLAAGLAILRYRLYEIDIVIRRTLVYGAVIAILAAVYSALVIGLQALLTQVTGSGTLPVAISTLVIAALFGPVRARVRAVVDRRFYRSRYDAQRTLDAFAGRLRDEVDIEAVGRALADASGRAVQPAQVGIWVRRAGP